MPPWFNRISLQHAEDVALAEDDELLAVDLNVGAGVLAVVDRVAGADADLHALAVVVELAGPDGDHLALGRLFLGRVGQDDATLGFLFRVVLPIV